MKNLSIMHVLQTKTNLGEKVHDLTLWNRLFGSFELIDNILKGSIVAILHNDMQLHFTCFINLLEMNYVWVIENLHKPCFLCSILLLLL